MIVNIQPTPITPVGVKVNIRMPDFELGATSGIAIAVIFNSEDNVVKSEKVLIPPEVYSQWGQDDNFITNYVLEQMNLIVVDE